MANQLLATFYVQLSQEPAQTVWAAVQGVSGLTAVVEPVAGNPLRYRIDVERIESQYYDDSKGENVGYYPFFKAGAYECKLVVHFGGEPLERLLYITIQPDVHVYRDVGGTQVDLATTTATTVSQNPLNRQLAVNVASTAPALAAQVINLNESPDGYKGTVFVKSNVPVDMSSNDLAAESDYNTWLQLADKIRITRKIRNSWNDSEYRWTGYDEQAKYVEFIGNSPVVSNNWWSSTGLLDIEAVRQKQAVELGLEKMPLALPLDFLSGFSLLGRGVDRYTGVGTATVTTAQIDVPFAVTLKTPHQIKITSEVLTLDEDNNYTSFVAIETNDDTGWTLATNNTKLTASPTSGTGRAAVVVKKAASFNLSIPFDSVTLTAVLTVGTSTVSDTSAVHLEKYEPTQNALIPKQQTGAFNHSLTDFGNIGTWGWQPTETFPLQWALDNLENAKFPKIELTFAQAHRIRSWSLQSVGEYYGYLGGDYWSKRVAATLVLQGWTGDNQWKILDVVKLSNFYVNTKPRVDKTVQHRELVSKIRVVVIETEGDWTYDENWNYVPTNIWIPQIQVFAGEPVIPKMYSAQGESVQINSSQGDEGYRVFDRAVSGGTAPVGSAAWYLNFGNTARNNVANRGVKCRLINFSSVCWLALTFPTSRLIGYLYSIDKLSTSEENFAKLPYAASLYFEGRTTADASAVGKTSVEGGWTELGLISLDKCIGFNQTSTSTATSLLAGAQTDLNAWANSVLGLTGNRRDRAFVINEVGEPNWSILQFNLSANTWQNKGKDFTIDLDAITDAENLTHYADFQTITALEQLRFVVQSVMNLMRVPVGLQQVLMPEMQLFGLPDKTINTGSEIATVSYLKAEDAEGNLHDILGRHQRLPFLSSNWYQMNFRFYVGDIENIKSDGKVLYLDIHPYGNGSMQPSTMSYDGKGCYETWVGVSTEMSYYELYVYSADGDKVILSSGYIGGQP